MLLNRLFGGPAKLDAGNTHHPKEEMLTYTEDRHQIFKLQYF